ncbi:MAG: hypothetical protein WCH11_03280 [Bdellovibrio sp.]
MIIFVLGFVIFITLAFVGLAFLFPEWVGIQGSLAQKIESEHRQDADEKKTQGPS